MYFLKTDEKDISLIKQCYEKTASSYLNEINLIPKAQLWYQYALWGIMRQCTTLVIKNISLSYSN